MLTGMVVDQKAQFKGTAAWFKNLGGNLRITSRGSVAFDASFYVPEVDFLGHIKSGNDQVVPYKNVIRRPDGTYQLDLILVESCLLGIPGGASFQYVSPFVGLKDGIPDALRPVVEEVEQNWADYLTAPDDEEDVIGLGCIRHFFPKLSNYSDLAFTTLGMGPSRIAMVHHFENVDAAAFTALQHFGSAPNFTHNKNVVGWKNGYSRAGYSVSWHPNAPGGEEYGIKYTRGIAYLRGRRCYNPVVTVVDKLLKTTHPDRSFVVKPAVSEQARLIMESAALLPGPDFMVWGSESGYTCADSGYILPGVTNKAGLPLQGAGYPAPLLTQDYVLDPNTNMNPFGKSVAKARLLEGARFCTRAALLAAEVFSADVEVWETTDSKDEAVLLTTIKNRGTVMTEDLPVSIFANDGTKIRGVKLLEINDDSLLF